MRLPEVKKPSEVHSGSRMARLDWNSRALGGPTCVALIGLSPHCGFVSSHLLLALRDLICSSLVFGFLH